jgi:hypothetical protein
MPTQAENRFYEFQAPSSLNGANGGLNGTNNLTRLNEYSLTNQLQRDQILQRSKYLNINLLVILSSLYLYLALELYPTTDSNITPYVQAASPTPIHTYAVR